MTNEEIIAAVREIKGATSCIDAVVDQVAEALGGQGIHDSDSERRLLGIAAMQKMLGKRRFDEVLGGLVKKPQGKLVLVPLSDKRPPINNAKNDFNDNDTEGANNG